MANGANPTKDEHFIPRVYLKGFSEIKRCKTKEKERAFIWQFNIQKMQQIPKPVNIGAICFQKHLYELREKDGTFIEQNRIENTFGRIETKAGSVIKSIKEKSQNEKFLNCTNVLSEDDQSVLIILITTMLYRDPKTIDFGIKSLQESNPNMGAREARNFALLNLLPLGADPEWDKNTVISTALKSLCGMSFQIGIADDDVIITSDRPVILWPPDKNELYNRPKAVAFPLTSRLVLYMFPLESVDSNCRNCFFKMNQDQIKDIQTNVTVSAREWIFSRNTLTKEQLEIVKEARNRLH